MDRQNPDLAPWVDESSGRRWAKIALMLAVSTVLIILVLWLSP